MPDDTRVLVAGAAGGTGRRLLSLLADRSVTVRCLTRSEAKAGRLRDRGADEVTVGDLLDPTDARRAADGVDVVCSAVGSSPLAVLREDTFVDGAGNRNLLEAALEADAEAFVMESALGVGDEPASLLGRGFDLVIRPVQRAKAEAEAALREAPIRHTVLRLGALTNGGRTDDVQVAPPGAKLWGPVSRADVARLMAAAPWTPAAADATFEVVRNPMVAGRAVDVEWRLPPGGP